MTNETIKVRIKYTDNPLIKELFGNNPFDVIEDIHNKEYYKTPDGYYSFLKSDCEVISPPSDKPQSAEELPVPAKIVGEIVRIMELAILSGNKDLLVAKMIDCQEVVERLLSEQLRSQQAKDGEMLFRVVADAYRKFKDQEVLACLNKRWTGNEIAKEIESNTDFGNERVVGVISLTIDLIRRQKEPPVPLAEDGEKENVEKLLLDFLTYFNGDAGLSKQEIVNNYLGSSKLFKQSQGE